MFSEETSVLPHFETADATNLVRELFHLFEEGGRWHESQEERCRLMLMSQDERDAAVEAHWAPYRAMTPEQQKMEDEKALIPLGNLVWVTELDEFGLCQHKKIDRNDVVVHAFGLGYDEPGRSDDPSFYVVYRPGDEGDYSKVCVVSKESQTGYLSYEWTVRPIKAMYDAYQQLMKRHGGRPYG